MADLCSSDRAQGHEPEAAVRDPWIATKERKPKGGQMIVKRWKNGAVWAGTHDEGPKNESFDWWIPLPELSQAASGRSHTAEPNEQDQSGSTHE